MNQPLADGPTKVLRDEHQLILRVLDVLRRLVARAQQGLAFETVALGQCVEFFHLFADACHHAKEEDLLFPVLESRGIQRAGGPIGVMLHEHKIARELTHAMGNALILVDGGDATAGARFCLLAREYITLLTNHISKEDHCLFAMGDQVMHEADQQDLCARFCETSCRSFGGKRREELTRLANALAAEWTEDR